MFERLSGYDYEFEVDSHVTKCSLGSYIDICEHDYRLETFPVDDREAERDFFKQRAAQVSEDEHVRDRDSSLATQKRNNDKGSVLRRANLILTAFHSLKMHKLQR